MHFTVTVALQWSASLKKILNKSNYLRILYIILEIANTVKYFMFASAILLIPCKWHSQAGTWQMFIKEEETSHNVSVT